MPMRKEEYFFQEIHNFNTFYRKITSLGVGGHELKKILSPYPTDTTYQIWLKLAQ